jgi:hypothetical protein
MTSRLVRSLSAAACGALVAAAFAVPAQAHTTGIHDNCTNFNEKYPHGVGRKTAVDKTSGTKVTTFKKSNKIYNTAVSHNADLDRDGDKIACEKA